MLRSKVTREMMERRGREEGGADGAQGRRISDIEKAAVWRGYGDAVCSL